MTRKEFLGQVGALFLAIIGISAILHALNSSPTSRTNAASNLQEGYGASTYGGE